LSVGEGFHWYPPVSGNPRSIAGNRWRLTDEGYSRDSQSASAALYDALTEFESLLAGKVTFKGEAIEQNLPQSQSSREIAHVPSVLYGFVKG
jgi:hypothetical protein